MRFYPLKDELNVWFVSFDNKEVELNPYDVYDLISYEKLNKIIITPPGCNWTKKMTEAVKKAKELSLQEQRIVYVESDEKPLEPLTIYA